MLTKVRALMHRSIESKALDGLLPVRISKDVLRRVNETLGRPLAGEAELEARAAAAARLEELKASKSAKAAARGSTLQAPITVYYERDQYASERRRIEEFLTSKNITFKALDVQDDETTRSFATTKAKTMDFPLVFVADDAIGGYRDLVAMDVSGELEKRLF